MFELSPGQLFFLGLLALTIIAFRKSRQPIPVPAVPADEGAENDERVEQRVRFLAELKSRRDLQAAQARYWWSRVAKAGGIAMVMTLLAIQDKNEPSATYPLVTEAKPQVAVAVSKPDEVPEVTPFEEKLEYSRRYRLLKINMHESEAVFLILNTDYMTKLGSTATGSGEYKLLRWDIRDGSAIELTFKDGYLVRKTQSGLRP